MNNHRLIVSPTSITFKKPWFLLVVLFVFTSKLSLAQHPFLSFGKTVFGVGTTSGIQPNYRPGEGTNFIYTTLDQEVAIKGIPFQLVGRWSNEPFISGRASYFRFSYQGRQFQRQKMDSISLQMKKLEYEKSLKLQELYALEGKLSYLKFVMYEQPQLDTFTQPSFVLPDSLMLNLPSGKLPELGEMSPLQQSFAFVNLALEMKQLEIQGIDSTLFALNTDYSNMDIGKFTQLLSGISRFDIGLSSLPAAHFSSNAIPIQGIRVRGKYQKWTYNLSAGLTVPNQLFSNQALDQVLNNTANLFNLSNFYQVNTTRFASATTLEYGEVGRNSFFIEDFYTGPVFEGFHPVWNTISSNATNIGGNYTPGFAKNMTLTGTLGYSASFNDTVKQSSENALAYMAGINYRFERARGEFSSKYRQIGSEYNGFAQGIYISGVKHAETAYRQAIGNRIMARITGMHDEFSNQDSLVRVSSINQATLDATWKLGERSVYYGSGTLLSTDVTANKGYSHLLKSGILLEQPFDNVSWVNQWDASYAKILGPDSNQVLVQTSLKSGLKRKHWGYAVKGTLQRFSGLQRVYGTNVILQPELSYTYAKSSLSVYGQYLISEQFGRDYGFSLNWTLSPSPFFTWRLTAQRWLVSETTFFLTNPAIDYKPFYLNFQMILTLNNKHK